ncbi:hypothetical protein ACFLZ8_06265 [Planctomycetota bacterium]
MKETKVTMRLTLEQRIAALERDNVVLQDRLTVLHKMLKEQRHLIKEYITLKVNTANNRELNTSETRPEDAVFTFICRQRFERLEKRIERLNKSIATSMPELKAG